MASWGRCMYETLGCFYTTSIYDGWNGSKVKQKMYRLLSYVKEKKKDV
jgi:hypothetical protein